VGICGGEALAGYQVVPLGEVAGGVVGETKKTVTPEIAAIMLAFRFDHTLAFRKYYS